MVMDFTDFKKNILDLQDIVIGLIISVLPVLITNFFFVMITDKDYSKLYNLLPSGILIFLFLIYNMSY